MWFFNSVNKPPPFFTDVHFELAGALKCDVSVRAYMIDILKRAPKGATYDSDPDGLKLSLMGGGGERGRGASNPISGELWKIAGKWRKMAALPKIADLNPPPPPPAE